MVPGALQVRLGLRAHHWNAGRAAGDEEDRDAVRLGEVVKVEGRLYHGIVTRDHPDRQLAGGIGEVGRSEVRVIGERGLVDVENECGRRHLGFAAAAAGHCG